MTCLERLTLELVLGDMPREPGSVDMVTCLERLAL